MWIIDKDHIAEPGAKPGTNQNAVGLMGPRDCDPSKVDACVHKFRIYDDDGELYYEGRCHVIDFYPLDDFGAPNAGATRIDFFTHGKWETL